MSQLRETVALMEANEKALTLKLQACDAEEKALSAKIAELVSIIGLQRGAYKCACRRRTKDEGESLPSSRRVSRANSCLQRCMRICQLLYA